MGRTVLPYLRVGRALPAVPGHQSVRKTHPTGTFRNGGQYFRKLLTLTTDHWQLIMGRTVLPYSQVWEAERQRWQKFRRALRKEDQAHLDRLFESARLHLQAGVYASNPWPSGVHAPVHAPGTPEGPDGLKEAPPKCRRAGQRHQDVGRPAGSPLQHAPFTYEKLSQNHLT